MNRTTWPLALLGKSSPEAQNKAGMERPHFEVDSNLTTFGVDRFLGKARKRIIVSGGRPSIKRLSNVIAHPKFTALYDEHGQRIPESSMYVMPLNAPSDVRERVAKARELMEPETIDVSDLTTSDKEVVLGGASHAHFGHHLLDGMNRLWHHSELPAIFLDAHPNRVGHPSFIAEYRALGRPRLSFDLSRPTLFTYLILPYASIQNNFRIYTNADAEHLAIASAALRRARKPLAAKVYLSRGGLVNRLCEGESELESALSDRGFEVVRPEELSIVDQIALFSRADWIVGQMGSAFHNVLFMPRGSRIKIVQFTWGKPNLRYPMVDRVKGHSSYYARTMEAITAGEKIISTRINVEQSLAVLQEIGALEPRLFFGHQPKRYFPRKWVLGLKDRIEFNCGPLA